MSYFFEAFPQEEARVMGDVTLDDSIEPGFFSGGGSLTMRGLAEAGRAVDLLGSVGPIIQDKLTGGTDAQDAYFREHDEVFNRAVDYWTPDPKSVHWSGQVLGGLGASLAQFAVSPGVMVGTQMLSTSEDLVRQGAPADAAILAGDIQGLTAAVGIWAPFVGSTWLRKAASGLAANVPLGIASRGLPSLLLEDTNPELAEQFKALDPVGLSTDIAMSLVFSGLAQAMDVPTRDAILAQHQARHLEVETLPGIPRDADSLNAHTRAMLKATEDLLEGRPVDVSAELKAAEFDAAARVEADAERAAATADLTKDYDNLPEPKPAEGETKPAEGETKPAEGGTQPPIRETPDGEADPDVTAAMQRVRQEDIDIPVGLDENGPVTMRASEALKAEPELPPNAFQAAVTCFLGS